MSTVAVVESGACRGVDRGLFFETRRVRHDNCQHSYFYAGQRESKTGSRRPVRFARGGGRQVRA